MPCENCLSRRDFLTTAAGAAGFVALSSCGDGFVTSPPSRPVLPAGPVVITVANFPGLAAAGQLVALPGQPIAVKRVNASAFQAFSMICTHEGCLVGITNSQQFDCPCHQSRFANDGAVLRGPATRPLPQFTASYDPATDQLTIS